MEILGKLFGSDARIRIIRLFLFNPEVPYDYEDIAFRSKLNTYIVKHETALLRKIGLIRSRVFMKYPLVKNGKVENGVNTKKIKSSGWVLDEKFQYLIPLRNLLINTALVRDEALVRKFAVCGKLKLLILAGIFIQESDSRVDILVVGDGIKTASFENAIRSLEAEIGKELRYAVFETSDFQYRLGMYDKLVRDILDYPHRKLLNKLFVVPSDVE